MVPGPSGQVDAEGQGAAGKKRPPPLLVGHRPECSTRPTGPHANNGDPAVVLYTRKAVLRIAAALTRQSPADTEGTVDTTEDQLIEHRELEVEKLDACVLIREAR